MEKKSKKFHPYWFGMLGGPFFFIFALLISAGIKATKFKTVMARFDANKTEENAIRVFNELNTVGTCQKFIFKSGSMSNCSPAMWLAFFNGRLNPCPHISSEIKKEIKELIVGLGVFGLDEVCEHTLTGDELGKLSEENVWFTLSQITSRGKYNVFSNIRMPYDSVSQKSQQFDNIIVCRKGVFLIEVKSKGGVAQSHSQQIGMHEAAFLQNFTNIAYKNLLVISWPRGQQTFINAADLPTSSLYAALTVDNLYEYIITYNGPDVLDDITIDRISQMLKTFINYEDNVPLTKWIIDGVEGKASSAESKEFCSACGKQLNSNALFCPYCGKKM